EIKHITGIPHSPTGQAIIECAHKMLKDMLQKQKRGSEKDSSQNRLNKALYVLNFLNRMNTEGDTPVELHFCAGRVERLMKVEKPPVMYKEICSNKWL
ncbi:POK8 protein, partial [Nothocercus nigrocapillus]|nr:POK8 protein [Nothocercus nigrocapillus]